MRTYETTFIINPQSDDSAIDQHVNAVTDLITGNGGNILRLNRIGTRRLAYDIQKLSQGYYTDIIFDGPVSLLGVLDRFYKLEEPYIRFLTVRFEGDLPPEQDSGSGDSDEDADESRDKDDDDSDDEDTKPQKVARPREEKPAEQETAESESEPEPVEEPVKAEEPQAEAKEAETKKEEEAPAPPRPTESDDDIL